MPILKKREKIQIQMQIQIQIHFKKFKNSNAGIFTYIFRYANILFYFSGYMIPHLN